MLAAKLAHTGVLWAEEDLPLAAALQVKRGLTLYREVWFDKPLLVPLVYLLWGAKTGWVLRLAGAIYGLLASVLAFAISKRLWGEREAHWASALMAFFLLFDTPSAVMPLAADLLMLVPYMLAFWLAVSRRPFWSGVAGGVAFLLNAKGAIVLGAALVFAWPGVAAIGRVLAGFAVPNLIALGWLESTGALGPYIEQVWHWMGLYAGDTFVEKPLPYGISKTLNWMGFHAVLVIGTAICFWKEPKWKLALVLLGSFTGVVLGLRFFPRYYFILLPLMTAMAARGLVLVKPKWIAWAALATMLVPMVRFGPKYVTLALGKEANWADLAMDRDSRAVSRLLAGNQGKLYVWGYRPEIFVYTGMEPATKYIECQALTGVPADRHLGQAHMVLTTGTAEARAEVIRARPDVVLDGLGPYNPALAITKYPDMAKMLEGYREGGRTTGTVIYLRDDRLQPVPTRQ